MNFWIVYGSHGSFLLLKMNLGSKIDSKNEP